ncbi:MAG: hypothetical protein ACR2P7_05790, partial [bacterium]
MCAPSVADESDWDPIDATSIIKQCWDISIEDRDSGVNARMVRGSQNSALCLENAVSENMNALFEDTTYSQNEIDADLKTMRETFGKFNWKLYNEHEGCGRFGWCGTVYY